MADAKKPNILVIFGDDIGITNLSCYSDGLMGYETPNIDRIAKEGIRFLHYYGEQSCTASLALSIAPVPTVRPRRLEHRLATQSTLFDSRGKARL